nr:MAG TPA: hypothetical protein [Caudoviricetes sp.]
MALLCLLCSKSNSLSRNQNCSIFCQCKTGQNPC